MMLCHCECWALNGTYNYDVHPLKNQKKLSNYTNQAIQ